MKQNAKIHRSREQNKFICSAEAQQYFCRRQIYAEAESNANELALACFIRRSREASGSQIRRAKHVMQAVGLALPRREPYFCPAGQISQKPGGAWRASQGGDGCPVCTGGGKVLRFRGK